jgi:hypoxanthine phosphoribosyltransferase
VTEPLPRCRLTRWAEVDGWADRLAEAIRAADRVPETLVALTRGGWVPARLLADRLGIKRMAAVRAQHWGVTATRDGHAELTEGLTAPVAGQQVLVVDDLTDTGESLMLAREHVLGHRPRRLDTATFLHIGHSSYRPDFFAEEIARDAWVWVVFPWNYWEDVRALAARVLSRGAAPSEVRSILARECGLEVSEADLRAALDPLPAPAQRTGK